MTPAARRGTEGWGAAIFGRHPPHFSTGVCIETLEDLGEKIPGLWASLTGSWASVRNLDNRNTTRRSVDPWWEAVQECAERFGEVREVKRDYARESVGKAEWFASHVAGCLVSFAALQGIEDLGEALERMSAAVRGSKVGREFRERARLKAAKLGRVVEETRDGGEGPGQ